MSSATASLDHDSAAASSELDALEKQLAGQLSEVLADPPDPPTSAPAPPKKRKRESRWGAPVPSAPEPAPKKARFTEEEKVGEEEPPLPDLSRNPPKPVPLGPNGKPVTMPKQIEDIGQYIRQECNYIEPHWGGVPPKANHAFDMKQQGRLVDHIQLGEIKKDGRSYYVFGRHEAADLRVPHRSCSRFHAILQPTKDGNFFIWDLSSSHGTVIWRIQSGQPMKVEPNQFVQLFPGDVVKFGICPIEYHLFVKSDPDSDFDVDRTICWDFIAGRCKKGSRCNWKHAIPANPNYKVPQNIQNVWEKRKQMQKHFQARFAQLCADDYAKAREGWPGR